MPDGVRLPSVSAKQKAPYAKALSSAVPIFLIRVLPASTTPAIDSSPWIMPGQLLCPIYLPQARQEAWCDNAEARSAYDNVM
jgi:hypothetical protein